MDFRQAKKQDFELFLPVKKEFCTDYGISGKSKGFILKEFLEYFEKGAIFLAVEKDKVVGYLLGTIEKDLYEEFGYIGEIFVTKVYRGKGVSTKLKDKFIGFLKLKNISKCRIEVSPENSALKKYMKWGFKVDKYRMEIKLK